MRRSYLSVMLTLACGLLAGVAAGQQPAPSKSTAAGSTVSENPAKDPLFDVAPLPQGKVSLVGGTVGKVDRVRNRLSVNVFGGGKMEMTFDERSHIYRDSVETTQLGIRKGDRVYVDTQLDGDKVFARNIRVEGSVVPADARGQVVEYDAKTGLMLLHEELSSQEVRFQVSPQTSVRHNGVAAARSDLRPGSLVAVRFAPGGPNRGAAQEISIIAVPGTSFVFAGRVTYLDLHLGAFAVDNRSDQKVYELRFDPASSRAADQLVVGADVTVEAVFDGQRYTARSISVNNARAAKEE